ncbi:MAG: multicopper oxidase domain-containing protein, partial [Candidatus Acidiferrum sp.]
MRTKLLCLLALLGTPAGGRVCAAQQVAGTNAKAGFPCTRGVEGATVPEPPDVFSKDGVLREELTFHSGVDAAGRPAYCYVDQNGNQEPTLRVHPGDAVILELKNEAEAKAAPGNDRALSALHQKIAAPAAAHEGNAVAPGLEICAGDAMKGGATNLHFHGMTVPPVCHQDDVLRTAVQPGDKTFEYRFVIPQDEPPGLYWYHPHVHGSAKAQVLGGASGALIVEGIERVNPELAGLPERVLVIRDQTLLNPDAAPAADAAGTMPPVVLDPDGDVKNTGTGTGKPALDLSLNFVPVPYPNYPPAV